MTRRLFGAVASLLTLLAGLWLALSPVALGMQPEGADWTDGTLAAVWTGLPLALVGLIGTIVFAGALRTRMVQAGYITPRPAPAAVPARSAEHPAADERPRELDTMLEPLIAALARDLERDGTRASESAAPTDPRPAVPADR